MELRSHPSYFSIEADPLNFPRTGNIIPIDIVKNPSPGAARRGEAL